MSIYIIYIYIHNLYDEMLIILGDRRKFYQRDLDLGRAKIKIKKSDIVR